jgi:hypothetical protein
MHSKWGALALLFNDAAALRINGASLCKDFRVVIIDQYWLQACSAF